MSFNQFIATKKEFTSAGVANYVIKNLGYAPIKNIQFTSKKCPQGYEPTQLGMWPGTKETKTSTVAQGLWGFWSPPKKKRKLSQDQIDESGGDQVDEQQIESFHSEKDFYYRPRYGRYRRRRKRKYGPKKTDPTIYAQPSKKLYLWQGQNVCIQRYKPNEYEFTTSPSCNNNQISCGSTLCVSNTQLCPITRLKKVYRSSSMKAPQYQDFHNIYKIEIIRDRISLPISTIEFTLSSLPCFSSPFRFDQRPVPRYPSLTQNLQEFGCSYGIDFNSTTIDSYREYQFYLNNGLKSPPFNINALSGYVSLTSRTQAHLVERNRLELKFDSQCHNINFSNIVNNIDHDFYYHLKLSGLCTLTMITVILESTFFGITIIALFVFFILHQKELYQDQISIPKLLCVGVCLQIPGLVVGSVTISKLKPVLEVFDKLDLSYLHILLKNGCISDPYLNKGLDDYKELHQSLNNKYNDLGFFSATLGIRFIFFIVFSLLLYRLLALIKKNKIVQYEK